MSNFGVWRWPLVMLLLLVAVVNVFGEGNPRFVENKGQYPEQVHFKLRVANADLYFETGALTFNVYDPEVFADHAEHHHKGSEPEMGHAYRMHFLGHDPNADVHATGEKYLDYQNFILKNRSVGHVSSFDRIEYNEIYPGIDIDYFGYEGNLKYDVKVAAGADPSQIRMKYEGVNSLKLRNGKLIVENSVNSVEESIPLAYQRINGLRVPVDCRYRLEGEIVSFEFPNGYDQNLELVIDPTLIFSSYTGSTSDNFGFTATYDASGALYGGGIVFGGGYPSTLGAYSTSFSGLIDMAISKFSPDGSTLIYSTYIGGSSADVPHSMIVNSQGQLVVLGSTSSLNYPTTSGAYDTDFNGGVAINYTSNGTNFQNGSDIVVSVLSADGSALIGSTYLGGSQNDGLNQDTDLAYNYGDIFRGEVIVDDLDNIYIASSTGSSDLPVTAGTIGQTLSGNQDACVAKFSPNVSTLIWCTYLGGDGADAGYSMKHNSLNELYVTGGTEGQGFPIVGSTLNTTYQGGQSDGFIVRLNNSATSIVGSTFIGTSTYDQSYFVEVDHDDDVYVYGQSEGNYPVVGSVYSNPNSRQFIQKLSADLSTSIVSTVFGNGSTGINISPTAFLVDVCKRIYIAGWGGGTNNFWNNTTNNTFGLPTTPNGFQLTTDGSDFYFMVLEADASSLLYATFFGGNGVNEHVDGGTSRFNSAGVIHEAVCAGCGGSDAFPTTPGAVSNTNNSPNCNLGVIKLDLEVPLVDVGINLDTVQTGCVPFTLQFIADTLIAPEFVWYFGTGDSSNAVNPTYTFNVPGTYEVLLIGRNTNCDGAQFVDTASVMVNAVTNSDTVSAGPDLFMCPGDTVQLDGFGVGTFSWMPAAFVSDPNAEDPLAFPDVTTEFVLQLFDTEGCSAFDTVLVEVAGLSVNVSADTTICIGDTINLNASGGISYAWSPNSDISDVSIPNPEVWPSSTNTYFLDVITSDGCEITESVLVAVQQLPNAFAGYDQGVCSAGTAQLNATGGVSYEWMPTAGLSNPNIADPVVTFSSDTVTYWVTVTDNIGCENTDTVTIWQEPLPNAVAGPDTTVCAGQSVQLTSSGGTTYSWSPAAGLNNPNAQNPTATPLTTTTYTVTVGQPTGNLIFNGDFSQGNVGFNSDYTYYDGPPNMGEALFSVVANANSIHNAFQGTGHTGNAPVDSFMVVNGAGTPNQNVWCQTISVSPNTDYFFGAWVSTVVASSPAILQFSINGQVLGAPFSAPFNINNWSQFYQTWNSGTATTATICVVNQNTNTGGNDFALDDITFSTYCTNTAEVTVTINPLPEADAGEDQQICYGDTTQLEGAGGVTYAWVPPIGIADPTDPTTDAYPNLTTTYTLIVEDNIGCTDTDEMTLTVNPLPAANAGPDHEVCIGESVILEGSGGTIYQWTPQTYLDDATAQLPVSTAEQTTTYTVTVTDNNNCTDSDSTTVTVNPLPIVEAGPDSMICANGSLVLQGNGAASYAWTPLIGLSDPQSATPTASPLSPTTYYVTGTDINGCIGSDSVSITIFGVAANSGSYIICLNDSVQASVSGGAGYVWSPAIGVSDTVSSEPYLSPTVSTDYIISVISQFGCVAQTEVNVQVLSLPIAAFSGSFDATCDGVYALFDNQSNNAQSYSWSFGNGETSSDFEPSQVYENGAGPIVTLYAYNNDSLCVDSITIDYSTQWFSNDSIEIEYTNVFTPNNDGLNDCFKPDFDARFSECYELKVFNRWGELIFESVAGQEHCWDGRTKGGNMVPEGTYYYISVIRGIDHAGYVQVLYE
ncbi:MAG: gliding motility-associated C-terminal domain-containing protein [Flavobacteriales bacterium]|nr:gliding motility-associated C-terminal domain-containing protein [Flavobacteriales bacterium]